MHYSEGVARQRRRRHSAEFKAEAVAACQKPGVSMAAAALERSINANLLRRFLHDVPDHPLQQACARGSLRLLGADVHARPPSDRFEPFDDREAGRGFVVHI